MIELKQKNAVEKLLLCTDLDRTLLPNGLQEESPQAWGYLKALADHPLTSLVYVSGRNLPLLEKAVTEYPIPTPDYAIGDMGTAMYRVRDGEWILMEEWDREIGRDWDGWDQWRIAGLFEDFDSLTVQEAEKLSRHKVSFYTKPDLDSGALMQAVEKRLSDNGLACNTIWSVDETKGIGHLDILPARANKYLAIQFLLNEMGISKERTVFAGDSGNDLDVLSSDLPAVLVGNATDEVRGMAIERASNNGTSESLYLACGDFLGMNGNYCAGVLEGLAYFFPEALEYMIRE